MNIQEVLGKAIYDALSSHPDIGSTQISRGNAQPNLSVNTIPYILMTLASGGILNDAPYDAADAEMLIIGLANSGTQVSALSTIIEESLRNKELTYPDGWHSWSTVRQTDLFSRSLTVQDEEWYQEGAYYRFRISRAKD